MAHATRAYVPPGAAVRSAIVVPLVFLWGCGCFYGVASEVILSPAHECVEVVAYAHCAWLGLLGTNLCDETLTLLAVEDAPPVEVLPGDSFDLDNVVPYAVMETDDAYCSTEVAVYAHLGEAPLTLSFDVERVNRGLRLPCD